MRWFLNLSLNRKLLLFGFATIISFAVFLAYVHTTTLHNIALLDQAKETHFPVLEFGYRNLAKLEELQATLNQAVSANETDMLGDAQAMAEDIRATLNAIGGMNPKLRYAVNTLVDQFDDYTTTAFYVSRNLINGNMRIENSQAFVAEMQRKHKLVSNGLYELHQSGKQNFSAVIEKLKLAAKRILFVGAVVAVCIGVLGVGVYFIVKITILRPIRNLIYSSKRVANGDLDHYADVRADDELGSLARSFNAMTDSLRQSYASLNSTNECLMAATKAKSVFLANMSHEIRTPLTAIIGFAESLLESSGLEPDNETAIHTIIRNGNHLQKIINDILDISKIEADKLEIETVNLSPFEILTDVEDIIALQAADKRLDFDIHYRFPLPATIHSDPLRLKQILINLCGNAVKFTEKGGIHIEVSCDIQAHKMCFDVIDSGIGLDERQKEKIFETFTQADTSTSRRYGGTGLGLPLSLQLARMLGGNIDVTGAPGVGSRFTVSIATGELNPSVLVQAVPKIKQVAADETRYILTEKISGKLLIGEDSMDNQKLIQMMLDKSALQCCFVDNGARVVERALAQRFDLIMLDLRMPHMDGIEVTRSLRDSGISQPIIAMSADTNKDIKQAWFKAGCTAFLNKPINKVEAHAVIAKCLMNNTRRPCVKTVPADDNNDSVQLHQNSHAVTLRGNILLAEDTPDNQRLIGMYVKKLGAALTVVENGKDAVDAALENDYDLILMDIQMPVMSGMEAIRLLKQNEYTKPVIAVTANALKHDRESYQLAGFADFIAKPIDRVRFAEVINYYMPQALEKIQTSLVPTAQDFVGAQEHTGTLSPVESGGEHNDIAGAQSNDALTELKAIADKLSALYLRMAAGAGNNQDKSTAAQIINFELYESNEPLISTLFNEDPELCEILSQFIVGLPAARECVNQSYLHNDYHQLKAELHKMKGTGGAFGYPLLSEVAKQMYQCVDNDEGREIEVWIQRLNAVIQRILDGYGDQHLSLHVTR